MAPSRQLALVLLLSCLCGGVCTPSPSSSPTRAPRALSEEQVDSLVGGTRIASGAAALCSAYAAFVAGVARTGGTAVVAQAQTATVVGSLAPDVLDSAVAQFSDGMEFVNLQFVPPIITNPLVTYGRRLGVSSMYANGMIGDSSEAFPRQLIVSDDDAGADYFVRFVFWFAAVWLVMLILHPMLQALATQLLRWWQSLQYKTQQTKYNNDDDNRHVDQNATLTVILRRVTTNATNSQSAPPKHRLTLRLVKADKLEATERPLPTLRDRLWLRVVELLFHSILLWRRAVLWTNRHCFRFCGRVGGRVTTAAKNTGIRGKIMEMTPRKRKNFDEVPEEAARFRYDHEFTDHHGNATDEEWEGEGEWDEEYGPAGSSLPPEDQGEEEEKHEEVEEEEEDAGEFVVSSLDRDAEYKEWLTTLRKKTKKEIHDVQSSHDKKCFLPHCVVVAHKPVAAGRASNIGQMMRASPAPETKDADGKDLGVEETKEAAGATVLQLQGPSRFEVRKRTESKPGSTTTTPWWYGREEFDVTDGGVVEVWAGPCFLGQVNLTKQDMNDSIDAAEKIFLKQTDRISSEAISRPPQVVMTYNLDRKNDWPPPPQPTPASVPPALQFPVPQMLLAITLLQSVALCSCLGFNDSTADFWVKLTAVVLFFVTMIVVLVGGIRVVKWGLAHHTYGVGQDALDALKAAKAEHKENEAKRQKRLSTPRGDGVVGSVRLTVVPTEQEKHKLMGSLQWKLNASVDRKWHDRLAIVLRMEELGEEGMSFVLVDLIRKVLVTVSAVMIKQLTIKLGAVIFFQVLFVAYIARFSPLNSFRTNLLQVLYILVELSIPAALLLHELEYTDDAQMLNEWVLGACFALIAGRVVDAAALLVWSLPWTKWHHSAAAIIIKLNKVSSQEVTHIANDLTDEILAEHRTDVSRVCNQWMENAQRIMKFGLSHNAAAHKTSFDHAVFALSTLLCDLEAERKWRAEDDRARLGNSDFVGMTDRQIMNRVASNPEEIGTEMLLTALTWLSEFDAVPVLEQRLQEHLISENMASIYPNEFPFIERAVRTMLRKRTSFLVQDTIFSFSLVDWAALKPVAGSKSGNSEQPTAAAAAAATTTAAAASAAAAAADSLNSALFSEPPVSPQSKGMAAVEEDGGLFPQLEFGSLTGKNGGFACFG